MYKTSSVIITYKLQKEDSKNSAIGITIIECLIKVYVPAENCFGEWTIL